jgi:hypothetical protein
MKSYRASLLALVTFAATFSNAQSLQNVVVGWNNAILQSIRDTKPGPPMVARDIAIVHTAMFDAWATYDAHADGTRLGGEIR